MSLEDAALGGIEWFLGWERRFLAQHFDKRLIWILHTAKSPQKKQSDCQYYTRRKRYKTHFARSWTNSTYELSNLQDHRSIKLNTGQLCGGSTVGSPGAGVWLGGQCFNPQTVRMNLDAEVKLFSPPPTTEVPLSKAFDLSTIPVELLSLHQIGVCTVQHARWNYPSLNEAKVHALLTECWW